MVARVDDAKEGDENNDISVAVVDVFGGCREDKNGRVVVLVVVLVVVVVVVV